MSDPTKNQRQTIRCGLYFDSSDTAGLLGWDRWHIRRSYGDGPMKTEHDNIFVRELNIDVDIPADFDPRPEQIAELERKRKEAQAAFHATMIEIDRQISQLQAIECGQEVAA